MKFLGFFILANIYLSTAISKVLRSERFQQTQYELQNRNTTDPGAHERPKFKGLEFVQLGLGIVFMIVGAYFKIRLKMNKKSRRSPETVSPGNQDINQVHQ